MRFGETDGRVAKLDAGLMPVLKLDEMEVKIQFRLLSYQRSRDLV